MSPLGTLSGTSAGKNPVWTGTDWEMRKRYRLVHETMGAIGSAQPVDTYGLSPTSATLKFASVGGALCSFKYDPALYAASGVKLRLVVDGITNATAPGASCTFRPGLYPASPAGGGLNIGLLSLGAVVTGSNPAAQGPLSATSLYSWDSGDFDAPASGLYVVGIVLAGATTAANSLTSLHARLLETRVS